MSTTYKVYLYLVIFLGLITETVPASAGIFIKDVYTDRASYAPQTVVRITVDLENRSGVALKHGKVVATCWRLDNLACALPSQAIDLTPESARSVTLTWPTPDRDFTGYGVSVAVIDKAGKVVDTASTAVDVSSTWTRFPRYGYVSSFGSQVAEKSSDEIASLCKYHINLIQFQDWQYRHEAPVAMDGGNPAATWKDIANRPAYRQTILDLIDASHHCGMATMNYNLIYGGWDGYQARGVSPKWGLYETAEATNQDKLPMPGGWATSAIYLFNPANRDWQNYIFGQEQNVFAAYPFDGWQADEVGGRGVEHDADGHEVDVWPTFRPFLNNAKAYLKRPIIFNNVGGYGLFDTAANADVDAIYVECWPSMGQHDYADLKKTIDQASQWSKGKPVILAAYMDYEFSNGFGRDHPGTFNTPGILITDAVILAAGGSHLELGDGTHLLDHEYFPNRNLAPSAELLEKLRRYYDFDVAYENLLRVSGAADSSKITANVPVSNDGRPGSVWTFSKSAGDYRVLSLINMVGLTTAAWRDDDGNVPVPTTQLGIHLKYYCGDLNVKSVSLASPDGRSIKPVPAEFVVGSDAGGRYVELTLPTLAYWDLVYLKTTNDAAKPPTSSPSTLDMKPGVDSATLTWKPVEGAASYNVYRRSGAGGEGATPIIRGLKETTYKDGGLASGQRYFYKISAVNDAGEGPMSEEVTGISIQAGPPVGHFAALISSANGRYIGIDTQHDNRLIAAFDTVGAGQTFAILATDAPGEIAIASPFTSRYVSNNLDGRSLLMAKWATSIGQWERFSWRDLGTGDVALISVANGAFISCSPGDGTITGSDNALSGQAQAFRFLDLGTIAR